MTPKLYSTASPFEAFESFTPRGIINELTGARSPLEAGIPLDDDSLPHQGGMSPIARELREHTQAAAATLEPQTRPQETYTSFHNGLAEVRRQDREARENLGREYASELPPAPFESQSAAELSLSRVSMAGDEQREDFARRFAKAREADYHADQNQFAPPPAPSTSRPSAEALQRFLEANRVE